MGTKRPWRVDVQGKSWTGWWSYETRARKADAVATFERLKRNAEAAYSAPAHTAIRAFNRETGEVVREWPKAKGPPIALDSWHALIEYLHAVSGEPRILWAWWVECVCLVGEA